MPKLDLTYRIEGSNQFPRLVVFLKDGTGRERSIYSTDVNPHYHSGEDRGPEAAAFGIIADKLNRLLDDD